MIKWHEEIPYDFSDPTIQHYFKEDAFFFDIETTGFSPARSSLYLIGCVSKKGDTLFIDQFFAETKEDEPLLLAEFISFSRNFHTIISFNGLGFDIPYLEGKCNTHKIPIAFHTFHFIDLYKEIAKEKALLGLPSFKQKSIEEFLSIPRNDLYSGGELIEIYREYRLHPNDSSLSVLKLHNYEDILHMPRLLSMLSYEDAFQNDFSIDQLSANEAKNFDGTEPKRELIFSLTLKNPVPKPVSYRYGDFYITIRKNTMRILITLCEDELHYFYENPKDYYYLPEEDIAILKTLATGVDPKHRIPANKSNCYTKKHAIFLPQYDAVFQPSFQKEKKDKIQYFELTNTFIHDVKSQKKYIKHIFSSINRKKRN